MKAFSCCFDLCVIWRTCLLITYFIASATLLDVWPIMVHCLCQDVFCRSEEPLPRSPWLWPWQKSTASSQRLGGARACIASGITQWQLFLCGLLTVTWHCCNMLSSKHYTVIAKYLRICFRTGNIVIVQKIILKSTHFSLYGPCQTVRFKITCRLVNHAHAILTDQLQFTSLVTWPPSCHLCQFLGGSCCPKSQDNGPRD